jgi:hypothetical protein
MLENVDDQGFHDRLFSQSLIPERTQAVMEHTPQSLWGEQLNGPATKKR